MKQASTIIVAVAIIGFGWFAPSRVSAQSNVRDFGPPHSSALPAGYVPANRNSGAGYVGSSGYPPAYIPPAYSATPYDGGYGQMGRGQYSAPPLPAALPPSLPIQHAPPVTYSPYGSAAQYPAYNVSQPVTNVGQPVAWQQPTYVQRPIVAPSVYTTGYAGTYPNMTMNEWSSTWPPSYTGTTLFGTSRTYDKQQPIRNVVRYILP